MHINVAIANKQMWHWTMCKSFAPPSSQITMPVPYHSVFTGWMTFLLHIQQHQNYFLVLFAFFVRLGFFSSKPRNWMGGIYPKWLILCRVERKNLNSVLYSV